MGELCKFCQTSDRRFTCPRCNADYCSLQCYRSSAHLACSEQFYKECVTEELRGQEADTQDKQKMVDILHRMNNQDDDEDVDSDDDEDPLDLAERLQGIDLDDAEETWAALTAEERRQFSELLSSGDVTSVLPDWSPWWSVRTQVKKIRELNEPEDTSHLERCPKLVANIPNFSLKTSPVLKFGLLNILYGYAYAVKYLHGDLSDSYLELVNIVQLFSGNLRGQNFDNADTALEAAASEVNHHQTLAISLKFSREVKKDVLSIIRGPSGSDSFYTLSALSDLVDQFKKSCKHLKNPDKAKKSNKENKLPPWLRQGQDEPALKHEDVKKHQKKIEFYLSWAKANHQSEFSEYF